MGNGLQPAAVRSHISGKSIPLISSPSAIMAQMAEKAGRELARVRLPCTGACSVRGHFTTGFWYYSTCVVLFYSCSRRWRGDEAAGRKRQEKKKPRKRKKKVQILKSIEIWIPVVFPGSLQARSGPGSAVSPRSLIILHRPSSSCVWVVTLLTRRGAILAAPQHVCCDVQSSSRELSPLKDKGKRARFDRQELEHRLVHV